MVWVPSFVMCSDIRMIPGIVCYNVGGVAVLTSEVLRLAPIITIVREM